MQTLWQADGYVRLLTEHPRFTSFGLLMAFASSFGQTYFVGIFGPSIQQDLLLTNTQWAGVYMVGTLLSALIIPITGKWIDSVYLPTYTFVVIGMLALACLLFSQSYSLWWLILAVFLLRQTGQGLMSHIAYTAMGRYFDRQRGKATALVPMGFALGEALLPILAVIMLASYGWRSSFLFVATLIMVCVLPMAIWLLKGHRQRHQDYQAHLLAIEEATNRYQGKAARESKTRRQVLCDYRFYLMLPGLMAMSLVSTAMFFYHLSIADEKGWSHLFITGNYVIYSLVAIIAAVLTGQFIDRLSAKQVISYSLLPLAIGLLILSQIDSYWVIWLYMIGMGISAGWSSTSLSVLWPECYGVKHLGAIKSLFWTLVVLGSSFGPMWLGSIVDLGYTFSQAMMTFVLYLLIASVMLFIGVGKFDKA